MNAHRLLIGLACANAVLYSLIMPLWEGFDEPFHFAYVQHLANGRGLPDPRTARLSGEVGASFRLAPASPVVKLNWPDVPSYSQYFSWSASTRADIRRRLNGIPGDLRWRSSPIPNYEAHQAPLAYLLLALPERVLAGMPLPSRVAILRLIAALSGALLLLAAAKRLFLQIGIRTPYNQAALFCLVGCQMTWATQAHVANDWLAVPIAVWMLVALNRFVISPSLRTVAVGAALLAAGLLTKAYFLAFVPLLAGACAWRRRWRELAVATVIVCGLAGPWYGRNLLRYGVLSGTQESRAGVGVTAALNAVRSMNWAAVIPASARFSVWTGNSSFLAFSENTLNLLIAIGLIALLFWAASRHASSEWMTVAYCVAFVGALGYATAASHVYTHRLAMGPSPWYAQVLSAPLAGLALLGASRSGRLGTALAALLVLLVGYIEVATYVVKLIPLYGGYGGHTSLREVVSLYAHGLSGLAANLDTVTLAPAGVVLGLAGVVIVLTIVLQIQLMSRLFSTRTDRRSPAISETRVGTALRG
jgi:hypothetical protein